MATEIPQANEKHPLEETMAGKPELLVGEVIETDASDIGK